MATVYWITGFSGVGKSILAVDISERLQAPGKTVFVLDGDEMRAIIPGNYGYTKEDRKSLAFFYAKLAHSLACQGVDVVCATISLFHAVQSWNRENIKNYVEIFLDAPIEDLKIRSNKNVYSPNSRLENVMGVDIAAELPLTPDIHVKWTPDLTEQILTEIVWEKILLRDIRKRN